MTVLFYYIDIVFKLFRLNLNARSKYVVQTGCTLLMCVMFIKTHNSLLTQCYLYSDAQCRGSNLCMHCNPIIIIMPACKSVTYIMQTVKNIVAQILTCQTAKEKINVHLKDLQGNSKNSKKVLL